MSDNKAPWMDLAIAEIGVKEKPGIGDNQRIIEYHAVTTLRAKKDSVPWCASFVSWVLEKSGIPSTRSASSLSYKKYGQTLKSPVKGCIVVFAHKAKPGTGHVTFFDSLTNEGKLLCLGGNQADQVKYSEYSTDELVGFRWPKGF